MNNIKAKIAKLINVKSIITIILTLVFSILCLCGVIPYESVVQIYSIVIAFYFGTQTMREREETNKNNKDT